MITKHLPGEPMTLGNMRQQGVRNLVAYCLNDSCRHQALIDVSSYPPDTPVPVRRQGRVRQVRGSRPAHRRATKLEGGAGLD
jgi:hypothetical protein